MNALPTRVQQQFNSTPLAAQDFRLQLPLPLSLDTNSNRAAFVQGAESDIRAALTRVALGEATMAEAIGPAVGCLMATVGTNMIATCIYDFEDPEDLEDLGVEQRIELWGLQVRRCVFCFMFGILHMKNAFIGAHSLLELRRAAPQTRNGTLFPANPHRVAEACFNVNGPPSALPCWTAGGRDCNPLQLQKLRISLFPTTLHATLCRRSPTTALAPCWTTRWWARTATASRRSSPGPPWTASTCPSACCTRCATTRWKTTSRAASACRGRSCCAGGCR